ncbi:MAG: polysaccharide export protein [Lysobacter sp.]|nr:polysaccharide export protein [Lysobacter sp.]MDQ3269617.1 polysaccharide export protein [Pseudomonadota bacterium]
MIKLQIETLLAALLLLAGCAGGAGLTRSDSSVVTPTQSLPAPDPANLAGADSPGAEYRIGPEDLLEISVYGLPDLSRTVRVNAGGQISLPLAGSFQAGGKTVVELEKAVAGKLQENYLQDPQVSVFVKEATSQRVTVEGAVRKPGIYPMTGSTTLLQAIAVAEGLDPLANPAGVVVFRTIDGQKMGAVFDIKAIRAGAMEDPRIYGNDIVVVDQSGPKTVLRRFIESVPALAIFAVF